MKDTLENILHTALVQIFEEIGAENISDIEYPKDDKNFQVILTIGIIGHITGTMMLKTDESSAVRLSQIMLNKINHYPENDAFTDSRQEAIREIMNLISSRTLMILSEQNIDCNLTPPTLIIGNKICPSMYNILYTVCTGVKGSFGDVYLFFGVIDENIS